MANSSEEEGITPEPATDDTADSRAYAEPSQRETGVKRFIGKLVKARKDLSFYPKGNPAVQASLEECERSQSEAIGRHGAQALIVSRDQFYLDDRALFDPDAPERRFAAELFGLGVRRISFTGEAAASEFQEFMSLLLEARDDPALFKSALSAPREESITGILLDEISDLEVADESSLTDEIDLALEGVDVDAEAPLDTEKVATDLYVRILPEKLKPEQIAELMERPVRIRTAFERLARAGEKAGAGAVAVEVASRVLDEIASTIAEAPLKDQDPLFRAASELLLEIEEPLRTKLLLEKVLPNVTSDNCEGALMRSLNDEELVGMLSTRLTVHKGVAPVAAKAFRNLGLSLPRRESVLELLREGTEQGGPEAQRYAELFDSLSDAAGVDVSADTSDPGVEVDLREVIPSGEALQLTQEERTRLDENVKSSGVMTNVENMPAVFDLFRLVADADHCRSLLGSLETLRKDAIEQGKLDVAIKVAEGYASQRQERDLSATKREIIEDAWGSAAGEETIRLLAQMSLRFERGSPEYALILEYLHTVVDRAYHVLLRRLEEEEDKSLRLAIRGLVIALGRANLDALKGRMVHKQWYVARNVVGILGEIGGEDVVQALAEALSHEEPRVRREVLNALGKIGAAKCADVLVRALDDTDDDVALCAARWLTSLGTEAPLDSLIPIVRSRRFRRIDFNTVLLAVQTVAQKDEPEAVGFLKKTARKRLGSLFGSGKRLADCAAKALRDRYG